MSTLYVVIGLVICQRLGELLYSARNTRLLKRDGAVETGRGHYPLFILLRGGWVLSLMVFLPVDAAGSRPALVLFGGLQATRVWVLAALGRYWTTRILTKPDAPLIVHGPYRYLRHPNYLIVVFEMALLPLAFGAFRIAVVFFVLNLLLLAWRIRVEAAALEPRRKLSASGLHIDIWPAAERTLRVRCPSSSLDDRLHD